MGAGLTRLAARGKAVAGLIVAVAVLAVPAVTRSAMVGSATVMIESVTVYATTSTRSRVVTSLARGAEVSIDVTIARPDGDWCRISANR